MNHDELREAAEEVGDETTLRLLDEIAALRIDRQKNQRLERDADQLMSERDAAQDALQETHLAMGGDGEWSVKIPAHPPPHSGDLHKDVPALAAALRRAADAARDALRDTIPVDVCTPIDGCVVIRSAAYRKLKEALAAIKALGNQSANAADEPSPNRKDG